MPFADHARAFTFAALLLAALATTTSLFSARLHRLAARPPEELTGAARERSEETAVGLTEERARKRGTSVVPATREGDGPQMSAATQ